METMPPNPPYGEAITHDAGHSFNYAVWSANSELSFHNVPWNSDYRDIVHFNNQKALDDYLVTVMGPKVTTVSYCRVNDPVRVQLPFNAVYKYNYLRVYNPAAPIGGDEPRTFYYFITDVQHIAPNTTQIMIQLDVWQTFNRYVTFGKCYIERGHIGIANKNQFDDHGRDYLTVPEGFDVGNEYVITKALEYTVADKSNANVLVASTTELHIDPGTVTDPNLSSSSGSLFEGLPNGMSLYLFKSMGDFRVSMLAIRDYPWIAQGIMSITVVPGNVYDNAGGETVRVPDDSAVTCKLLNTTATIPGQNINSPDFRINFTIPSRYSRLEKFKTYPYSVLELTTYNGAPLLIKPECIATDALKVRIAYHIAPPSPRMIIYPLKYNGKKYADDDSAFDDMADDGKPLVNDRGEFLDFSTGIFDLPQFSIANNGYLSYMAANAHRVAYAYRSADWSQQRAMAGVQLGYNQSTVGAGNQFEQMMNNVQAMWGQANLQGNMGRVQGQIGALGNVAHGVGSGHAQGLLGGVIGAGQNLAGGELDYIRAMTSGAIQNTQMIGNAQLARETQLYNRDTNRDYGTFAARGDYANEIAGINARVQDAALTQPTTSGQLGGEAAHIALFKWGLFYKYKVLQPAVMAAIGEFWLRYGYAINRFGRMPANYRVMQKFTYWKLKETYITASACPESFKQAIRGIFEKGVTVWTNPTDIGNIDIADNAPLTGVTL